MATSTTNQLSEKRLELVSRVQAVVDKKRAYGITNGALVGHTDLLNALRDPQRIVHYCPSCLVVETSAVCRRKSGQFVSCDAETFTILVGE